MNSKAFLDTRHILRNMGSMSCLSYLNGTPEAVYEEAVRCIRNAKAGGRFALGSGGVIPRYTLSEILLSHRRL